MSSAPWTLASGAGRTGTALGVGLEDPLGADSATASLASAIAPPAEHNGQRALAEPGDVLDQVGPDPGHLAREVFLSVSPLLSPWAAATVSRMAWTSGYTSPGR